MFWSNSLIFDGCRFRHNNFEVPTSRTTTIIGAGYAVIYVARIHIYQQTAVYCYSMGSIVVHINSDNHLDFISVHGNGVCTIPCLFNANDLCLCLVRVDSAIIWIHDFSSCSSNVYMAYFFYIMDYNGTAESGYLCYVGIYIGIETDPNHTLSIFVDSEQEIKHFFASHYITFSDVSSIFQNNQDMRSWFSR